MVTVTPATSTNTGVWISDSGAIEVTWPNVFVNRHHVNNHLLAPVERLVSSVLEDDTMDDGERELVLLI